MVKFPTQNRVHREQLLLLGTLFALSLADGIITRYIVSTGLGAEVNPFLQPWVQESGFFWLKVVGTAIAMLLLWHLYTKYYRKIIVITAVFVGIYIVIVYWNVSIVLVGNV